VDKAEDEAELAFLVNHQAVENLAKACTKEHVFLVHISTDYIFDGTNYKPYSESDPPSPNSVYGHSKLKGEEAVIELAENWSIIRTSWLYSFYGHNFVKTIMRYGNERDVLKVVNDQIGTPTNAGDLAQSILEMIAKPLPEQNHQIYHFSNEGVTSWYDFAKAIIEESEINCKVVPIESKDFPAKANRPFYSVLNKARISTDYGFEIPHWRDSLKTVLKKLIDKK
jgi:dTDP-4-dehydrorhamnose reductase